jgi:hypothetical protein
VGYELMGQRLRHWSLAMRHRRREKRDVKLMWPPSTQEAGRHGSPASCGSLMHIKLGSNHLEDTAIGSGDSEHSTLFQPETFPC